jgi:exonuclease 3'-5' domain-containing protein 2
VKKRKLDHLTRPHYSNIILVDPTNSLLTTISKRKAQWYVSRNLGVFIEPPEGYTNAVKLLFTPSIKNPGSLKKQANLNVCDNKCVICGSTITLTLHHVIPHVIRRYFPPLDKEFSRQWCVLLCEHHHGIIETDLWQTVYKANNFPDGVSSSYEDMNKSLIKLKESGDILKIPKDRLEFLLKKSLYVSVDEIPPMDLDEIKVFRKNRSIEHKKLIEKWSLTFIKQHGGIEGTKQYFKEHFLTYNPKFLPEGWLED